MYHPSLAATPALAVQLFYWSLTASGWDSSGLCPRCHASYQKEVPEQTYSQLATTSGLRAPLFTLWFRKIKIYRSHCFACSHYKYILSFTDCITMPAGRYSLYYVLGETRGRAHGLGGCFLTSLIHNQRLLSPESSPQITDLYSREGHY